MSYAFGGDMQFVSHASCRLVDQGGQAEERRGRGRGGGRVGRRGDGRGGE